MSNNRVATRIRRRTIKKRIRTTIIIIIFIILYTLACYMDTTYTRDSIVVSVDGINIVCCDNDGNEWELKAEGLVVGQEVELIIDNNCGSYTITDDKVKGINIIEPQM